MNKVFREKKWGKCPKPVESKCLKIIKNDKF